MREIEARFASRCAACKKAINVGDTIIRPVRGEPWVHVACKAAAPRPKNPRPPKGPKQATTVDDFALEQGVAEELKADAESAGKWVVADRDAEAALRAAGAASRIVAGSGYVKDQALRKELARGGDEDGIDDLVGYGEDERRKVLRQSLRGIFEALDEIDGSTIPGPKVQRERLERLDDQLTRLARSLLEDEEKSEDR